MHLFFYGILQADIAEGPVRDLLTGIGPGVPATARGDLYAVRDGAGAYPAMVAGDGTVGGMMHEGGTVDLAALDVFEGHEYRRAGIEVVAAGRSFAAEAYLWAGTVDGLEPIAHGSFGAWLQENGLSAWSTEG